MSTGATDGSGRAVGPSRRCRRPPGCGTRPGGRPTGATASGRAKRHPAPCRHGRGRRGRRGATATGATCRHRPSVTDRSGPRTGPAATTASSPPSAHRATSSGVGRRGPTVRVSSALTPACRGGRSTSSAVGAPGPGAVGFGVRRSRTRDPGLPRTLGTPTAVGASSVSRTPRRASRCAHTGGATGRRGTRRRGSPPQPSPDSRGSADRRGGPCGTTTGAACATGRAAARRPSRYTPGGTARGPRRPRRAGRPQTRRSSPTSASGGTVSVARHRHSPSACASGRPPAGTPGHLPHASPVVRGPPSVDGEWSWTVPGSPPPVPCPGLLRHNAGAHKVWSEECARTQDQGAHEYGRLLTL